MKRRDNTSNNNDTSKRVRQEQQSAFNEDSAAIHALLLASHETELNSSTRSLQGTNPEASTFSFSETSSSQSSAIGGSGGAVGNSDYESRSISDSSPNVGNNNERGEGTRNENANIIHDNDVPQALTQNGNRNGNMRRFLTSSDEEDDDADDTAGRAWLSAPAPGQRCAPRLGSEFQANLPAPGEN